MKSKRLWLIVSSLLALVTIGGCSMFQQNSEKDKYKKEQDRMVKYLADNYEDVQKVEFKTFEKNNTTGTWSSDAIVNNTYYITFSLNGLGGEIEVTEHISKSKGKELSIRSKEKNTDISAIEVIYVEE